MNIPSYRTFNALVIADIQWMIRLAITGADDSVAMALDDLLAGKPDLIPTALAIMHQWIKPYA